MLKTETLVRRLWEKSVFATIVLEFSWKMLSKIIQVWIGINVVSRKEAQKLKTLNPFLFYPRLLKRLEISLVMSGKSIRFGNPRSRLIESLMQSPWNDSQVFHQHSALSSLRYSLLPLAVPNYQFHIEGFKDVFLVNYTVHSASDRKLVGISGVDYCISESNQSVCRGWLRRAFGIKKPMHG